MIATGVEKALKKMFVGNMAFRPLAMPTLLGFSTSSIIMRPTGSPGSFWPTASLLLVDRELDCAVRHSLPASLIRCHTVSIFRRKRERLLVITRHISSSTRCSQCVTHGRGDIASRRAATQVGRDDTGGSHLFHRFQKARRSVYFAKMFEH